MYSKNVLRYYKLYLNMCNKIASISIEWDGVNQRLKSVQSPNRLRQFKLNLTIAVVHNIFLIVNLFVRDTPKFGVAYHMLAIYFTIGYIMCNGCRVVCWLMEDELIKLVNAQLGFEKTLNMYKSFQIWRDKGKARLERHKYKLYV